MKTKALITLLLSCLAYYTMNAQTLKDSVDVLYENYFTLLKTKDSVEVMYKNYFDLLKTKDKVDSINDVIKNIENRYNEFNTVLQSNNQKIQSLTDAELFTLQTQLATKRNKIINTSAFISSANVSLNAIKLLDAVTDYLNDISALNSPENEELGFSLNSEIKNILNEKIIKGKKRVNGGNVSKFLNVVDNIIKNPITEALSSAVPVVGSIKSVIDLVMGTATRGKDVTVDDIVSFKTNLKDYLEHYEGLAQAQNNFNQILNSVDVRKEALILLLRQYTTERVTTLYPTLTKQQLASLTITQMITQHYSKDDVQQAVDQIISRNATDFDLLLNDSKLTYPEYGLSQAKFIRDEIESLGKEYIAVYESYQLAISEVLIKSKSIGKENLIEEKIKVLKEKLFKVETSFTDALNIDNLNKKFSALSHY